MSRRDAFGLPRDQTIGVIYRQETAQSCAGSSTTILNFETVEQDPMGLVVTGSSWRFNCPEQGFYVVGASVLMQSAAGGEHLKLFKNGVLASTLCRQVGPSTLQAQISGTRLIWLGEGDYLDFRYTNVNGPAILTNASTLSSGDADCYCFIYKA